ncbi:hypothetical protein Pint_15926 [Pistacia integerrima]|uniref:Uncharacterized protein n=1 Tax=Pistacia integerrima TaxID=434235 RepID=A0ACC0ZFX7_9ROSI|nr:hypothetical protein Pint_15926 [Pistacia integerrima]
MSEFRDCIEELEIKDICQASIMFTWNGKPHGDNGVMKKPDRIFVAKPRPFKFFNYIAHKAEFKVAVKKPSMRALNRKQGNLSRNVKILKHEVEIIQGALDWDPHNSELHDHEAIFSEAFRGHFLMKKDFLSRSLRVKCYG